MARKSKLSPKERQEVVLMLLRRDHLHRRDVQACREDDLRQGRLAGGGSMPSWL